MAGSERDPRGAAFRQQWIKEAGLWYSDDDEAHDFDAAMECGEEITARFVGLAVRLVQALHGQGVIERSFGRPVPVLIHELEYHDKIVDQNRVANPPELVADFGRWVQSS